MAAGGIQAALLPDGSPAPLQADQQPNIGPLAAMSKATITAGQLDQTNELLRKILVALCLRLDLDPTQL
jgi:hypothetical protein